MPNTALLGLSVAEQTNLVLAAVTTVYVALTLILVLLTRRSAHTDSLMELMRFLQDPYVRTARSVVNREGELDLSDQTVRDAASTVCANYDSLGVLLQQRAFSGPAPLFIETYAWSICRSHSRLQPYIQQVRREAPLSYLENFDWLANEARDALSRLRDRR